MKPKTQEIPVQVTNGWVMMGVTIVLALLALGCFGRFLYGALPEKNPQVVDLVFAGMAILSFISFLFMLGGFFTLQPNLAAVLTLFGKYKGTVLEDGLHWTNPFVKREKISLRSVNFNVPTLKVNDLRGNPIEIGAVVVWKVLNTAQAMFDVDDYHDYVEVQSESALRHLANSYPYDHGENGDESEVTLRSDTEEVSGGLLRELQERLSNAGVIVEEARLSHLAYAPEIAGAMLRRQQAEAVIAARRKIVDGAVSMVEMALKELADKKVVNLDEDRRAAMVSNLLVVLCSESETQPVVNAGSLYN